MLRTASSLPLTGLLTLGSDPARFPARPPACYRASWQLPGPDFHRQATTSLRTRRNTMALRHGVTSRSAGRTRKPQSLTAPNGGPRAMAADQSLSLSVIGTLVRRVPYRRFSADGSRRRSWFIRRADRPDLLGHNCRPLSVAEEVDLCPPTGNIRVYCGARTQLGLGGSLPRTGLVPSSTRP
jgi:hypothetical protein